MSRFDLYRRLRPLLFALDPERAHVLTLKALGLLHRVPGFPALLRALYANRTPALPVEVMGLRFRNPIGLAAGLDKHAEAADAFADLGFGFVELGTVTPLPQPGNPRPRLFRLSRHGALINRMGFNSVGLERFVNNLARRKTAIPRGVNLGKNAATPLERAADDYCAGLRAVYTHADYVAINISSPNTAGLRDLQGEKNLEQLLHALKREQTALAERHGRYVPIALKVAPDLGDEQIAVIARLVLSHRFDAVIATNTTVARPGLDHEPLAREAGGLSGRPLRELSTAAIRGLYRQLQGRVPIIGAGGVSDAADAWEKLVAGADLVQIYSALIYAGPGIVRRIVTDLAARVQAAGCTTLAEAVAQARRRGGG